MRRIKKILFFSLLFLIHFFGLLAQESKPNHPTSPIIDSLLHVLQTSKEDSTKLNTLVMLGQKLFGLIFAKEGGDYIAVLQYAKKAEALADKLNNRRQKGEALFTQSHVYYQKGNLAEAMKLRLQILKIAEETGDKRCEAQQHYGIGMIYADIDKNEEAMVHYLISLKMKKELEMINTFPQTYNRIAGLYEKKGNYQEALNNYQEGIEASEKINDTHWKGVLYKGIGWVYFKLGNNADAVKYLYEGLKIMREGEEKFYEAEISNTIGEYYIKQAYATSRTIAKKNFDSAYLYYTNALKICKEKELNWMMIGVYSGLSEYFKGIKDYQKALGYYDLSSKIKDSLFNSNSYNKVAEVTIKYETEKEAALQKARLEKLKIEKENRNKLLLICTVSVLIVSAFFLLYLRQRQLKKRAIEKAETVHKMAELEMQSLRSQMNPHFMFNSLNSLQRLILMEENDKSQSYLARFAKMLRMLLDNADKPFIPLQTEIDFLQLYLSLEKLRVPDLQYSISTDPVLNTEQTFVPNMILQPYVENAIWHGLSHKENDKQIQIRIYRENGTVNCEIEDNGVGRKKAEELKTLFRKQHQSKGMELLAKRFKLLNEEYGSNIQSIITDLKKNDEDSGVLVTIKVPVMLSRQMQN
ncbi:MAG: histidine kinase [Chitinophagaceae bacterium]